VIYSTTPREEKVMYAGNIKIESEEDGFWLAVHAPTFTHRWKIDDPEEFYDHVRSEIGPWLAERENGRLAFLCSPEDVDESGGYDISDPKHPRFHSVHADLWDSRAGK
jgi:hypothetical protein